MMTCSCSFDWTSLKRLNQVYLNVLKIRSTALRLAAVNRISCSQTKIGTAPSEDNRYRPSCMDKRQLELPRVPVATVYDFGDSALRFARARPAECCSSVRLSRYLICPCILMPPIRQRCKKGFDSALRHNFFTPKISLTPTISPKMTLTLRPEPYETLNMTPPAEPRTSQKLVSIHIKRRKRDGRWRRTFWLSRYNVIKVVDLRDLQARSNYQPHSRPNFQVQVPQSIAMRDDVYNAHYRASGGCRWGRQRSVEGFAGGCQRDRQFAIAAAIGRPWPLRSRRLYAKSPVNLDQMAPDYIQGRHYCSNYPGVPTRFLRAPFFDLLRGQKGLSASRAG